MRASEFYIPTQRSTAQKDSINAYLLTKAGYISQVSAGVYALMPLAVRTLQKIEQIVREEMNRLGASETIFSAMQPKQTWHDSGRWEDKNFRQILYSDDSSEMTFAPTHEEPMALAVKEKVQSYRDLPITLYQFQTKFRRELRAKSGLLRGREFRMKDLYSFHPDEESHNNYYEKVADAYNTIFERLGLETYRVKASGGVFSSQYSDEYQVICKTGEDEILVNHKEKTGFNQEVEKDLTEKQKETLERVSSIEVGNIFHLGTKYSQALGLQYLNPEGVRKDVVMGSYGIGTTRILGALAEIYNDANGLMLPPQVAPFQIHLIDLTASKEGEKLLSELEKAGYDVLLDDRELPAGAKLVEADLIGIPVRLVVSPKTIEKKQVEIKQRSSKDVIQLSSAELMSELKKILP